MFLALRNLSQDAVVFEAPYKFAFPHTCVFGALTMVLWNRWSLCNPSFLLKSTHSPLVFYWPILNLTIWCCLWLGGLLLVSEAYVQSHLKIDFVSKFTHASTPQPHQSLQLNGILEDVLWESLKKSSFSVMSNLWVCELWVSLWKVCQDSNLI